MSNLQQIDIATEFQPSLLTQHTTDAKLKKRCHPLINWGVEHGMFTRETDPSKKTHKHKYKLASSQVLEQIVCVYMILQH